MDDREVILKVENLSKQYRLGLVGTGTLSHDFNRWWHRIRGKEDPYLKIGETNDRSTKGESEYVWALRDINFEVRRGEVLGIIGKNGAGKSTLLKILSRVTSPTTGSIKTKGRIASLLEVGTGFHGEMTGRENIYLNGAILGMTKKEITAKIDEIIEFSGCERYIDTPVKRYSSGMTVRLAFAVAAFLEPDILIVDEVLAVGDAEFQKKAIGKMQDISSGEGRTVLFVSHNMASVRKLCSRILLLKNGMVQKDGPPSLIIDLYNEIDYSMSGTRVEFNFENDLLFISHISIDKSSVSSLSFNYFEELKFCISYKSFVSKKSFVFILRIYNMLDEILFTTWDSDYLTDRQITKNEDQLLYCYVPSRIFKPGKYRVSFYVSIPGKELLFQSESVFVYQIAEEGHIINQNRQGIISPQFMWEEICV